MKWRSVKGYCNEIGCSEMRISLLSSLIATITKRITFATQILEIAYYGMRCLWKKQMSRTFSFDPFWLLSNTRLLWPISLSPILLVLHLIAQSSFLLCLIAFPRAQTFDERNYSNTQLIRDFALFHGSGKCVEIFALFFVKKLAT